MSDKSDEELLQNWKRQAGTPLVVRLGVAGFLWSVALSEFLALEAASTGVIVFSFWFVAAAAFVYQTFIRGRISLADQFQNMRVSSRLFETAGMDSEQR
jgi:hypothetical protein